MSPNWWVYDSAKCISIAQHPQEVPRNKNDWDRGFPSTIRVFSSHKILILKKKGSLDPSFYGQFCRSINKILNKTILSLKQYIRALLPSKQNVFLQCSICRGIKVHEEKLILVIVEIFICIFKLHNL